MFLVDGEYFGTIILLILNELHLSIKLKINKIVIHISILLVFIKISLHILIITYSPTCVVVVVVVVVDVLMLMSTLNFVIKVGFDFDDYLLVDGSRKPLFLYHGIRIFIVQECAHRKYDAAKLSLLTLFRGLYN